MDCTFYNRETETEPVFLEQTTATTWAPGREQLILSDFLSCNKTASTRQLHQQAGTVDSSRQPAIEGDNWTFCNREAETEPAFLEQTTATTWAPGREQLILSDFLSCNKTASTRQLHQQANSPVTPPDSQQLKAITGPFAIGKPKPNQRF